jgi:non-ribosomal peptide synthetase component F
MEPKEGAWHGTRDIRSPVLREVWMIYCSHVCIIKAGGACVSLDPSHPLNRLYNIIKQVRPPVALVSNDNFALFAGRTPNILVVGSKSFENGHAANGEVIVRFRKPAEPHNGTFVISSSGNTGKPEGSVFEQASIATSSKVYGDMLQLRSRSRVLLFSSYAFTRVSWMSSILSWQAAPSEHHQTLRE